MTNSSQFARNCADFSTESSRSLELSQQEGLCGAPEYKSLSVILISWLQEIGFIQPPWPSPSSTVANKETEEMRRQGRNSQKKQSCNLGTGLGSPSRDIYNNIFELFCRHWNPITWEKLEGCWWLSGRESACQFRRQGLNPWVGKIPWRRKSQPNLVFLPRKSHGWGNLVGCSPWGRKESDKTEHPRTPIST